MNIRTHSALVRTLAPACAAAMFASSAHAGFHLWTIQELFTNLDGTQQFIELSAPAAPNGNSQQFVGGKTIQVKDQSNTTTHTFSIPSNLGSGSTGGRTFLLATGGLQAAGAPAPDYTIPNGFIFAAGGTITFFGTPSPVTYTALPTDGFTSHAVPGDTSQVNSPKNFSNQTGSVPEPTTWGLIGLSGFGLCMLFRRRATA